MFHKLRIKLTLTNSVIFSLIIFVFALSVFVAMKKMSDDQTARMMSLIAADAGVQTQQGSNHGKHADRLRYFYVRVDASGNVVSGSQGVNQAGAEVAEAIRQAVRDRDVRGHLEIDEESYMFGKSGTGSDGQTLITFVSTRSEKELMKILLAVMLIAGMGGLGLVFAGSLYMANRSLVPVREAWERQRDFVANASHELRTPLAVIQTTLELLMGKRSETIESQMRWMDNIRTENERMSRLVADLLLLARADAEPGQGDFRPVELHRVLLEAYIPFEPVAMKKGIHLRPFDGEPLLLQADEEKIKQLVVILVDNAIKYTPPGGDVGLSLRLSEHQAELMVTDTGEGIEEAEQERIFRRFYRTDKARSRKEGSTGLGLSIADWIVRLHRGYIRVDSLPGQGSTFTVILPGATPAE